MFENIRRYKYLPFNKGSRQIITNGTIKFSLPSECNDPFECSPYQESDDTFEYINSRPDLTERVAKELGLNPKQLINEKSTMIKRLQTSKENGEYNKQISDSVGICSLTKDPLNLLMWAHYAEKHTGFVVEFDIQIESDEPFQNEVEFFEQLIPHEVTYQVDRPIVNSFDSPHTSSNKQYLTKGIDWWYEQEERIVDYKRKSGIHKYEHKILYSVIAGLNMSEPNFDILKKDINTTNKIKNLNIKLHRVIKVNSKSNFKLSVPERPDLKMTQKESHQQSQ